MNRILLKNAKRFAVLMSWYRTYKDFLDRKQWNHLDMAKLAIGSAQFGLFYGVSAQSGPTCVKDVKEILSLAQSNDISIIDTAISYGTSEETLGKAGLKGAEIVTKLPPLPTGERNIARWVFDQVEGSLSRLGKKNLYGLLLHKPRDLLSQDGQVLFDSLIALKEKSIVKYVGVSVYDPEELDDVYKQYKPDLVQAPLNVVDRRMHTSGWLDRLKEDDVIVQTRSCFLQGLLLMAPQDVPKKFSRWSSLWSRWEATLRAESITALAACLAYPLSLEQVDHVVVGVDRPEQLSEILATALGYRKAVDTSFMSSMDKNLIHPPNWQFL